MRLPELEINEKNHIEIAKKCSEIGIPEPGEVKSILSEHIVIQGKACIPVGPEVRPPSQKSLF